MLWSWKGCSSAGARRNDPGNLDLSVTVLDSASCRFTNQVLSHPTPAFLETLKVAGISFQDAVADRQAASDNHNRRETALYAQSLERKALARN